VRPLRDRPVRRVDALVLDAARRDPLVVALLRALADAAAEVSADTPTDPETGPKPGSWQPPVFVAGGEPSASLRSRRGPT
jgi:hypothetical protein